MKKIIAIFLVFMIVVPTMAFADTTTSSELENALVAVKTRVEIPSDLTVFENNI